MPDNADPSPPTTSTRVKPGQFLDWGIKILALLVIPLVLWGVKLEVANAVMERDIEELQGDMVAAKAIEAGVAQNTNSLGRLEVQIEMVSDDIRELKDLLRAR